MISTFFGSGEMGDSTVVEIVSSAVQYRDQVFAIGHQLTLTVVVQLEFKHAQPDR